MATSGENFYLSPFVAPLVAILQIILSLFLREICRLQKTTFHPFHVLHLKVHPEHRNRGNTKCIEKVLLLAFSKHGTKKKGENLSFVALPLLWHLAWS